MVMDRVLEIELGLALVVGLVLVISIRTLLLF